MHPRQPSPALRAPAPALAGEGLRLSRLARLAREGEGNLKLFSLLLESEFAGSGGDNRDRRDNRWPIAQHSARAPGAGEGENRRRG